MPIKPTNQSSCPADLWKNTDRLTSEELTSNLQPEASKEIVKKSLEFEEDTFTIASKDWDEVTPEAAEKNPLLERFLTCGYRVKANTTGDVIEYLEWPQQGEQLFIFDYKVASERERFLGYIASAKWCSINEVEQRYFLTKEEFKEKMQYIPKWSTDYKKWVEKNIKEKHMAGYWDAKSKKCYSGLQFVLWLADGYLALFDKDEYDVSYSSSLFGFSVRLLKN